MKWAMLILVTCALLANSSTYAVTATPIIKPWLRLRGQAHHLIVSPKADRYIAFTDDKGRHLQVLDTRSQDVYLVTKHMVGQAFFWAPDGLRLFYRELSKSKAKTAQSTVKAFDMLGLHSVEVAQYPHLTGILTFDPRDLRMHLLSPTGLHTKRIYFPDQRLAQWQVAQRTQTGKWLATDQGIIWATDGGFSLQTMKDDGSGLQSFSISPDGTAITWATKQGKVYTSVDGTTPKDIGFGTDPRWHPEKPYVLMAGARMIGDKAIDYDIKLVDQTGSSKFLTYTQGIAERWPAWTPDGKSIIYTKSGTTDIFRIEFVGEP